MATTEPAFQLEGLKGDCAAVSLHGKAIHFHFAGKPPIPVAAAELCSVEQVADCYGLLGACSRTESHWRDLRRESEQRSGEHLSMINDPTFVSKVYILVEMDSVELPHAELVFFQSAARTQINHTDVAEAIKDAELWAARLRNFRKRAMPLTL